MLSSFEKSLIEQFRKGTTFIIFSFVTPHAGIADSLA